jgi:hypothetical protein
MKKILFSLLLFGSLSFSFEEDPIATLKINSENYFNQFKRTKLKLDFNQSMAAPGDTLRFSTSYLNANNLKPVQGRQVVHICLFDQFGKKQLTRWADVINGYASSEMVIPKDFPSGIYKLVAFTDWMKNFDSSLFYQQKFTIVEKYLIRQILQQDTLIFFPEGGSLVANLENNIAMRFTGKPTNTRVTIREGERELTSLLMMKDSIGVYHFTPKSGIHYSAEINSEDGLKRFALPPVEASGIVLQVDATGSRIKINSECTGNLKSNKENFYIAAFNNNGLIFQSKMDFDDSNKSSLQLPSSLSRGIIQLIVFNSKLSLLASRVIHVGGINTNEVNLDNLQDIYGIRQEVKLDLKVKDRDGTAVSGHYSCSVVNEDLFREPEPNEMDYFNFQSDISNSFGLKNDQTNQQLINNYLISQSCPWFVWKDIINGNRRALIKPLQYLMLSGRATYAKNGKSVADSTLIMFFLEKSLMGYETRADKKGNFSFPLLLSVKHPDRFYYTATLKGKDVNDIALQMHDSDSSISFSAAPWVVDKSTVDQYAVYSSQVQTINNSYSFFLNPMPSDSVDEPNKAIEDELNGADLTVNLNDYLMMPTMEEVVREIVKAVEYRKIGGRQLVRVYTIGKVPTYSAGPLFVIDGVITKDPTYFFDLKPADVISIKVVRDIKKLFALGNLGANGVILVKTKLRTKVVKEKHTIDFSGLLPESHHPFLGYKNNTIPDLRSCMFWTSKSFSGAESLIFKTSDDVGKFKIRISGLADDGTLLHSEHRFQTKYQGN